MNGDATLREHIAMVEGGEPLRELWVETPLEDGWFAAFRLFEERGRMIVGELRVFPGGDDRPAGRWRAESLIGPLATVPLGGLTARNVRGVRFEMAQTFAREIIERHLSAQPDDGVALRRYWEASRLGASMPAWESRPERNPAARSRWTAAQYVDLAARYAAKVQEGRRAPVAELAREMEYSPARIRQALTHARAQGWLTETPRRRAGGTLTDAGLAIARSGTKAKSG